VAPRRGTSHGGGAAWKARTARATARVDHSARRTSDIAMRPKLRNASVVARTRLPKRAARREKRSVPSHAVARRTPTAASEVTARPAPGETPRRRIDAAISQYVSAGLS